MPRKKRWEGNLATEKKKQKRHKISHGRTRNFTEKDRSIDTEKTED